MVATAHIHVRGISWANYKDNPKHKYALRLVNINTNSKTPLFEFTYGESSDLDFKLYSKIHRGESAAFKIIVYKFSFLSKKKFASVTIPLSAFPDNRVCSEKIACDMEDMKMIPISIIFDMHLNIDRARSYSVPKGKSNLPTFDSGEFYNYHVQEYKKQNEPMVNTSLLMQ